MQLRRSVRAAPLDAGWFSDVGRRLPGRLRSSRDRFPLRALERRRQRRLPVVGLRPALRSRTVAGVQQPLTSPMLDLFLELCAIPSPSGQERAVADRVGAYLTRARARVGRGRCGRGARRDTGNLYCRFPPTNGGRDADLPLRAHGHGAARGRDRARRRRGRHRPERRRHDPRLRQQGRGRRDARGGAADLGEGRPHAGIELVFTPQEEVSLRGAAAFDHTRLHARTGFVYDQGAPIGEIVVGSPYGRLLDFRFHGRAPTPACSRGRPLGRRGGRARDRRLPPRPHRRRDERERRRDQRRHRAERRPRVVLVHGRGALARRAQGVELVREMLETPRSRPASRSARSRARCGRASPATASARATSRCAWRRRRCDRRASSRATRSPAAARTRTSSTRAGSGA